MDIEVALVHEHVFTVCCLTVCLEHVLVTDHELWGHKYKVYAGTGVGINQHS